MADEKAGEKNPKAVWSWAVDHWQTTLPVVIGSVCELASNIGAKFGGPAWLSYGHTVFVLLVATGAIAGASAQKVIELENAVSALNKEKKGD